MNSDKLYYRWTCCCAIESFDPRTHGPSYTFRLMNDTWLHPRTNKRDFTQTDQLKWEWKAHSCYLLSFTLKPRKTAKTASFCIQFCYIGWVLQLLRRHRLIIDQKYFKSLFEIEICLARARPLKRGLNMFNTPIQVYPSVRMLTGTLVSL